MKTKTTPRQKALISFKKQLNKVKTLTSLRPKLGEWYSILTIADDGRIDRHTVIVDGKTHVMTPKWAGDFLEMGACLDPIWLSKEEARKHIEFHKDTLSRLIERTKQKEKKEAYQRELMNLQTFEKRAFGIRDFNHFL